MLDYWSKLPIFGAKPITMGVHEKQTEPGWGLISGCGL